MAGGGSSDGRSPRIDLVPIIDAMTCVIFFLLLSSTFVEFTKITMPQAVSSVASASVAATDPPLSPKLIGVISGNYINMILSWTGKKPDRLVKRVMRDPQNGRSETLQATTQGIVNEFKKQFPQEKTLLLGFSPEVTYQEVISSMDGARQEIDDLVMVSWTEAKSVEDQAKAQAPNSEPAKVEQ